MNDILFAGDYSALNAESGKKLNKCLKVIIPVCDGALTANGENVCYGKGDYVVLPPYSRYEGNFNGALTVCIEQPLLRNSLPVRAIKDSANGGMENAALQAREYYESGACPAVLAALGQLIVGYVAEKCTVTLHPVVEQIKADMQKNFTDCTYSAETALRKIPLNYDYVRKLFKKETGVTPHEYLNDARMNRARLYIENGVANSYSNFTVSQIAEACGFNEPLYFSRVFKKRFGVSPMQYAKTPTPIE